MAKSGPVTAPPANDVERSLAASTKRAKAQATESSNATTVNPDAVPPVIPATQERDLPVFAIRGIFLISLVAALYFAREFVLPVAVAFILALTLSPVVRAGKRYHIPQAVSSIAIVVSMVGATVIGLFLLTTPVTEWIDRAPQIAQQIESKLSGLRDGVAAIQDAEEQVEDMSSNGNVQTVTIKGPGFASSAASTILSLLTSLTITAVLLAFLLSSGEMFYAKLVRAYDTLRDKKRALRIAHDVERVVSRYLFTITIINLCLGIAVGITMWLLNMPTPYIWGMLAAVANFIPYIGALLGVAAASAVALVTFPELTTVAVVASAYFACTFIEGQIITPLVLGRRLSLNAVAVFISVGFWAWLWGIVGALIAVPILVIAKTICDHFEELENVANFLSGSSDD
ncbi:MAG: AI-2E family transporter [Pseudomonadota bacterium]